MPVKTTETKLTELQQAEKERQDLRKKMNELNTKVKSLGGSTADISYNFTGEREYTSKKTGKKGIAVGVFLNGTFPDHVSIAVAECILASADEIRKDIADYRKGKAERAAKDTTGVG